MYIIGSKFSILYYFLYSVCNYNFGVFYHMFKCINPTFWLQIKYILSYLICWYLLSYVLTLILLYMFLFLFCWAPNENTNIVIGFPRINIFK